MHKKFHSEAETAIRGHKTACRAVMSCKTMLQAAKSGYCTSVASEMGTKSGQKGIKVCTKKFHSEAETAFVVEKTAG